MSSNSAQLLHDIRAEFASLLDFVTGEEAQTATVAAIERGLFQRLFALGATLLTFFLTMRAHACARAPVTTDTGVPLPYQSEKKRVDCSIFGKIPFWRPSCYRAGAGGGSPLDASLSRARDCYSALLRELGAFLSVSVAYETAAEILQRFLGIARSTRVLKAMLASDAADVEPSDEQQAPPSPASEAEIVVIQADGTGVPIVREPPVDPTVRLGKGEKRARKKEAVVPGV